MVMTDPNIRAFVAIPLPEPIKDELKRLIRWFIDARITGVRWIPTENIHLTLKFLGQASKSDLETFLNRLTTTAQNHHSFDIAISRIGAFPNIRRARVVWAGLQAPPELIRLQKEIDVQSATIGCLPEERSFLPHLTFGRVDKNISPTELTLLAAALNKIPGHEIGRFQVKQFVLYRSDLRPSGAVYTHLAQFDLNH